MAFVHLREASVQTAVTTYTLRVRYETYDVLSDPCAFAASDKSSILAAAGLASTLTWGQCSLFSSTLVGGIHRYLLDITVTG